MIWIMVKVHEKNKIGHYKTVNDKEKKDESDS